MNEGAKLLLQIASDASMARTAADCVCRFHLPEMGATFIKGQKRIQERVGLIDALYRRARGLVASQIDSEVCRAARDQFDAADQALAASLKQLDYLRGMLKIDPMGAVSMTEEAKGYLELIDPKNYGL